MIKTKNISVFGLFSNRRQVEEALRQLRFAGFARNAVAVMMPAGSSEHELAHKRSSRAAEGMTAGAGVGALFGAIVGFLIGMGLFAVPWLVPLATAGPAMAALAGLAIVGLVGAIVGGLVGAQLPRYVAQRAEGPGERGILLSVHADSSEDAREARNLLALFDARDVGAVTEAPAH